MELNLRVGRAKAKAWDVAVLRLAEMRVLGRGENEREGFKSRYGLLSSTLIRPGLPNLDAIRLEIKNFASAVLKDWTSRANGACMEVSARRYPGVANSGPASTGLAVVEALEWSSVYEWRHSMSTSQIGRRTDRQALNDNLGAASSAVQVDALGRNTRAITSARSTAVAARQKTRSRQKQSTSEGEARPLNKGKKQATTQRKSRLSKKVRPPTKGETKGDRILKLLRRSGGASMADLIKVTGWQAHSVRGYLSATIKRQMGLTLVSERADARDRRYRII